MDLFEVKELISNLAVITTILQFLSGILVCRQYVINKTTGEASVLPFLCGILSSGFWLLYGLTIYNNKIVFVNIIGITTMSAYSAVFYMYTFKKAAILKQIFFTFFLLLFTLGYASTEEDKKMLSSRIGLIACSLTLLTVAAPMSKLIYVLKVRSTECLPFPMIVMSFFVSTLWFLYGVMENDKYLSLPNFIGASLAMGQLSLFLIYPRTSQSHALTKSMVA